MEGLCGPSLQPEGRVLLSDSEIYLKIVLKAATGNFLDGTVQMHGVNGREGWDWG